MLISNRNFQKKIPKPKTKGSITLSRRIFIACSKTIEVT